MTSLPKRKNKFTSIFIFYNYFTSYFLFSSLFISLLFISLFLIFFFLEDYLLSNSTTNTNNNTNNNNTLNRRRSETNTDDINYEPMSRLPDDKKPGSIPKKSESLTLRVSDETRVASAIYEASKKRKTGSIYSLSIQLSSNGTLGLGVKALKNNILVISMLKRVGGQLGPGEAAGVRLGYFLFYFLHIFNFF